MKSFFLALALVITLSLSAQNVTNITIGQKFSVGTNVSNVVSGGGGGDTTWLTMVSVGSPRNNFDGVVGCTITIGTTITLTQLAAYVFSSSSQTHRIGIWDTGFTKLAEVSLNKTGLSAGMHKVPLGSPLVLTPGTYYFGEEEFVSGDNFNNADETFTTTAAAVITASSFHSAAYDAPSSVASAGVFCFGPVGFDYH